MKLEPRLLCRCLCLVLFYAVLGVSPVAGQEERDGQEAGGVTPEPAAAQDPDFYYGEFKHLRLETKVFFANYRQKFQVNSPVGIGTLFDLSLFGLESTATIPVVELAWRINPRHRMDFTAYASDRDGNATVDQDIDFGPINIPAGSGVSIRLKAKYYSVDYKYALFRSKKHEAGVAGGLGIIDLEYDLTATDTMNSERVRGSLIVPNAVFGFYGDHHLSRRWLLGYRGEYLPVLQIDKYEGSIFDIAMTAEFYPWKHVGFGGGLSAYAIDVKVKAEEPADFSGRVDYLVQGAMVYLVLAF